MGEIHRELLFLVQKVTKAYRNTQKFFFHNTFEKGQILKKIWICLNQKIYQTSKFGGDINKNFFLLKVSHKQLNYVFRLFWGFLGEIHWELPFLVKKVTILERRTKILRKFVSLNMFEKSKILTKIWICLNKFFWSNR